MLTQVADQVAMAVSNAMAFRQIAELRDRLSQEKQYLEEEINLENRFEDIVGESAGLRQVLKEIETVAPTDATVLIQGETGTGKELLARAIHRLSPRSERTFVKLNCAAIPAGLIGERAVRPREGRVHRSHCAQDWAGWNWHTKARCFWTKSAKCRSICNRSCCAHCRSGRSSGWAEPRPIPVNVRLIAATNRDLAKMVAEKEFRSDLYYRLKVFPIFSPPLRERPAIFRCWCGILCRRTAGAWARRSRRFQARPWQRWCAGPGRAISANSRTSWSAR